MRILFILLAIAAFAQTEWPPAGMRCPQRTLVISEFGENTAPSAQLRAEHLDYTRGLMKSGKVIAAGPMADHQRGAYLFATSDWPEVEQLLNKDPFHREHVLKVMSHDVWNACEAAP